MKFLWSGRNTKRWCRRQPIVIIVIGPFQNWMFQKHKWYWPANYSLTIDIVQWLDVRNKIHQNTNFSLTIHIDLAMKNWLYDEYNDINHRDYRNKCWWPNLGTSLEWCTVWAIPKMAKLLSPDITRYMYPMYPIYVYPMYILPICMGWTASKIRKQLLSYCNKKGFSSGIANIRCESHGGMLCLEANCEYTVPPNICQPWERTLTDGEAKPFAGFLVWFFSDTIFHFCGMGPASRWFCSVSTRYQLQFVLFELFDDWLSGSDGILGPDNLLILV